MSDLHKKKFFGKQLNVWFEQTVTLATLKMGNDDITNRNRHKVVQKKCNFTRFPFATFTIVRTQIYNTESIFYSFSLILSCCYASHFYRFSFLHSNNLISSYVIKLTKKKINHQIKIMLIQPLLVHSILLYELID